MMRNIKMLLQYEGTRYQGWQKQESNEHTIQGKLEMLLSKMCSENIILQGSGRTDAGVHALGQIANFHTTCAMETQQMQDYINQYLPEDIAVLALEEVPERFHSRLNATGKCYQYQVINSKVPDVFRRRYALQLPETLNVEAMRQAAALLCGEHDFRAFTSSRKGKKSTIRKIEDIKIDKKDTLITFTFCGNGFLYHMVRILVGTLLEIGTGQRTLEEIPLLFQKGERSMAGYLVPAKGLTLVEVFYPHIYGK